MFILTGGAGFIGSAFLAKLNSEGIENVIVVDDLGSDDKWKNLAGKNFANLVHKDELFKLAAEKKVDRISRNDPIQAIIHLGACSATTERDVEYLMQNNYNYTRLLAEYAVENKIRFIYASSAATYGKGNNGYSDDHQNIKKLRPLNPYGFSKQLFDQYALSKGWLHSVAGLKFFNVFGPNEYHKNEMRSVVLKAYEQVKTTGTIKLFKSYNPEYKDGDQKRDFVYIKDCVRMIYWFLKNPRTNGIFNIGSGKAKTWNVLARAVFSALNKDPVIEYIDMPEGLRSQYQYFTQADMTKLSATSCQHGCENLQDSIKDYIVNYLEAENPYI